MHRKEKAECERAVGPAGEVAKTVALQAAFASAAGAPQVKR